MKYNNSATGVHDPTWKTKGAQFPVGDERLGLKQIADRAGCSLWTARKYLVVGNEDPLKFIIRYKKLHAND